MRALITGVAGFAGRHLARHLHAAGDAVVGLVRSSAPPSADLSGTQLVQGDLLDRERIHEIVRSVRPDAVYHLAAQSSSSQSLADPWSTLANNLRGQMHLLDAVLATGLSESR